MTVPAGKDREPESAGRGRLLTTASAVVLALAGLAAIAVGRHESPPAEPKLTAPTAAVATENDATEGKATEGKATEGKATEGKATANQTGVLTTGRLLPASPPTRVEIPTLHVDVPVTGLGLQPDGSMAVPADARTVGWYTRAPTPGSLGPAILAGHVDYHGADGTFARLATLRAGDRVRVTRRDGVVAEFAITHVDRYPKDRFPSGAVYGPIDHAGLRLITCGGDFDRRAGHYADNIVAYADLR